MSGTSELSTQITLSNNITLFNEGNNSLTQWVEAYFKYEVTTSQNSRKEQLRDIKYFVEYMINE